MLARLPLTSVLAVSLMGLAAAAPAQVVRGNSALRGRVVDQSGRPMPGALVIRDGSADTARADSLGRFAIERLALGRHLFIVRHPGYEGMELEVNFPYDTSFTVDIPMEPSRGAGGAAFNTAKLDSVGFTERRRQAEATGLAATFLGPAEIAQRGAVRVAQLLEGVPEITVQGERGGMTMVYGADRRCLMNVWVEGQRLENVFQASSGGGGGGRRGAAAGSRNPGLDGLLRPDRVAAIEVYPAASRTPAQFAGGTACGALVIWTR